MNWIKVPSFAKVNLGLYILEKRTDGFHSIESIFQTISLKDLLYFKLEGRKIEITSNNPDLPNDSSNLIYKAAQFFKNTESKNFGVKIRVDKRIPLGSGLGGGSSNAAATLLTLNRLFDYPKKFEELTEFAQHLGSDVPFFLKGGTALVSGRGEKIKWKKDIPILNFLLANPSFTISTKDAYKWWDNSEKQDLTNEDLSLILQRMQEGKKEILCKLRNSFQGIIVGKYPQLKDIMEKLNRLEPINVMLSGSGPTIFAIFGSEKYNYRMGDLKEDKYTLTNCRSISRKEYFNLLKPKED
ncbi:4-(cytidine 5'-diphospho)-2-C-methyl-D-erythritol kinase [candidate division WOR-3 bacterium]|nr:4-(cytidine 5'-diphospho)-2-C-methyl-D-erythritol kinase [candidate division WOR-3 bacterium]